ncbi:MAG TPA: ABC transporter substrate-binding protein [Candidatus Dormibacteraeota bacterium]|nr:ABC transporter substrate-binding protein [Candidatus Dormibacteraeota bacterium]
MSRSSTVTFVANQPTRRNFLKTAALGAAAVGAGAASLEAMLAACGGAAPSASSTAAPVQDVNWRLGWLAGSQQGGEFVAIEKGYFKQAGINLVVQPGGPNLDSVSLVANGSATVGQISSSPSLILARAHGIPVRAFASALQKHPFAWFTLKKDNITSPRDWVGKKIGIQGTARPLLNAVVAKYNLNPDSFQTVVIGSDTLPLVNGQVQAASGWVIDSAQEAALPANGYDVMLLWDLGIQLYANPYFATDDTIKNNKKMLEGFVTAAGKGWEYAFAHQDEAIDIVMRHVQGLKRDQELATLKSMPPFTWNAATRQHGFGTMDLTLWQKQIDLYVSLKLIDKSFPASDIATVDILNGAPDRPKQ